MMKKEKANVKSGASAKRFMTTILAALVLEFSAGEVVAADPVSDLQERIFAHDELSADFTSRVEKKGGKVQTSSGTLALKRPGSLMMHTQKPDELLLFTKDDAICYYDPFVNQLSIFSKSQSSSSPFVLLTTRDKSVWSGYRVERDGESWVLTPKRPRDVLSMRISFDGQNISALTLTLKDGSTSVYELSSVKNSVSKDAFDTSIPSDAEVDDERGAD